MESSEIVEKKLQNCYHDTTSERDKMDRLYQKILHKSTRILD